MPDALLFDLDGTFADTAPDLGAALNRLRAERNLAGLPIEVLRPHASHGVRGLLGVGFGLLPGDPEYAALAQRFLDHYESALCVDTSLFEGVPELIDRLDALGVPWGIVTNKRQRYTLPLLQQVGLARRPGCVVSGDSSLRPKPDPAPLLMSSRLLGVAPERCAYIGDDVRDMRAARSAGMLPVAAAYGYLGCEEPLDDWGAEVVIETVADARLLIR